MTDRRLRVAGIVMAVLGLGVAGYLTYIHYAGIEPLCNIAHGCVKVQTSEYAELAGIPVAVLGLGGYVAILFALILDGESGRMAAALFALVGFGFSAYLTYRELFTIDAICQWCVVSAILMTGLAVITVWRMLSIPAPVRTASATT